MPPHEINAVEHGGNMHINYALKNKYGLRMGDVLIAELKRHFDENKKLRLEIELTARAGLTSPRSARNHKGIRHKGRRLHRDNLQEAQRGEEEMEIYPSKTKKFLDFNPE